MTVQKLALIILDGWGIGPDYNADAIATAHTPFYDSIFKNNPHTMLITFGEDVGLPDGQMGNSEVGHLNLGAGRIVYQELARINKAVRTKELNENTELLNLISRCKANGNRIHLIGLLSDGGVHSHINHLLALCDILQSHEIDKVSIHGFMDGRDCDPKSGISFVQRLNQHIAGTRAQLVSICGRYFAMDRDKRWERIKKAYDLLVHGIGDRATNAESALIKAYASNITDEFIEPTLFGEINPEL
ncbi:MAG: 2,3-bisphosphoglycerate-independent phosphoglycerate mutase, partial [Saprospiraceae bacterium]